MSDTPGHPPTTESAADGPTTPAELNSVRGELATQMGIELTGATAERVTGRMPVVGNRQPYGLLHGGASAVLAETLGSIHAVTAIGPQGTAVGLELSCTHHRGARDGFVHGESTPLFVGRTVATFEIVVTNDAGERVCTARLTCVVRRKKP